MKKFFVTVFLFALAKVVPAQVATTFFAEATIVHPVGTAEFQAEATPLVTHSAEQTVSAFLIPPLAGIKEEKSLTTFRVFSNAFVYSISTVAPERNFIRVPVKERLLGVAVKPVATSGKAHIFSLSANLDRAELNATPFVRNILPEIAINFN